jgi:uncharacterized Ntn-hydrolase superfamily protein
VTYSIVARDQETGELAVAVQSHFFGVGRLCPFVRAGVGAVATQASVDPAYGPRGLKRMEDGESPEEALAALVAADPGQASRQVAMIDAQGRVATHTGDSTIAEAGHVIGDQFSVQANMMLNPTVPAAMAEAFQSSTGDLVDRILDALDAAEAEGGDIRGRQSAALLVTGGAPGGEPGADRTWDLRVDDNPEPLAELRRLVTIKRGYDLGFMKADAPFEDIDQALLQIEDATGGNPEMTYWAAIALTSMGRLDDGRRLMARARAADPNWAELLRRLPAAGNAPQVIVDLLLKED